LTLFNLIIIVLALSAEAFGVIYLNGFLKDKTTKLPAKTRVLLFVPLVNLVMAALGYFTGEILTSILEEFAKGLSIGIIFIVGLKLIIKSFKPKFREMTWELTNQKVLISFSFALGINLFLLGLALPGFGVEIFPLSLATIITFLFAVLMGLIFGNKSSNFLLASRLMLAGGVVVASSAVYYMLISLNFV
jgi:putative Mn2+ efflux pump MntP